MGKISLIAIGSSTGGVEALSEILPRLHPPLPPIVIVQHIPPDFSRMFADRINRECFLTIKEGENGEFVRENFAYIAPGGLHMKVCRYGGERLQIRCFMAPPVAEEVGASALGVILTGIGKDGAAGLLEMRQKGAVTLGQDKDSSIVYGMPRSAFEIGAVERQIPLAGMAFAISAIAHKN